MTTSGFEFADEMILRGQIPDRYFAAARKLIDNLDAINKAARLRRFRERKTKEQAEHYARSVAAKMGLRGVRIRVVIEDAA